ncbi:MAG: hypothetical protein ACK559_23145, partial [bacterium]
MVRHYSHAPKMRPRRGQTGHDISQQGRVQNGTLLAAGGETKPSTLVKGPLRSEIMDGRPA